MALVSYCVVLYDSYNLTPCSRRLKRDRRTETDVIRAQAHRPHGQGELGMARTPKVTAPGRDAVMASMLTCSPHAPNEWVPGSQARFRTQPTAHGAVKVPGSAPPASAVGLSFFF